MISLQQGLENPTLKLTLLEDTNLASSSLPTYNSYLKVFFEWSEITGIQEFIQLPDGDLQILMDMYVKHLRMRVQNNEISPNTLPKVFKPMRKLLDVNYREHAVKWKPIHAQFPAEEKLSGYKPWETSQINLMLDACMNLRETAVVLYHSSTGSRVGVHDHSFLMKHMIPVYTPSGEKCYAFLIYAEADETVMEKDTRLASEVIDDNDYSHFVFTNPEATIAIDNYHDFRKKRGEVFHDNTWIFKSLRLNAEGQYYQMSGNGFQKTMQRILFRTPLTRIKKRNRFDIQIDHGFRKRFNTILKIDNDVNSNIAEKLMQHLKGLDGTYLTPTREQCFAEFVKAISQLTISNDERQRLELQKKDQEISDLQAEQELRADIQKQLDEEKEARLASEIEIKQTLAKLREEKLENFKMN